MKNLKTIEEIKKAVDEGKEVYVDTAYYRVIKDNKNQYLIKANNGHCIGLGSDNSLNASNFFHV